MLSMPTTQYAKAADGTHLAYQVVGDAPSPFDLMLIPPWSSHVELGWENPGWVAFYSRLCAFSRLILIDKRGTGLSDRLPSNEVPTIEQRTGDVCAVLDAIGSERTVMVTLSDGGPTSLLFAATYPERTQALVLQGCWARGIQAPDYPYGWDPATFDALVRRVEEEWGQGIAAELILPTLLTVPGVREAIARVERFSASPGTAGALLRMAFEGDVRPVLAAVRTPTLVLHRAGDRFVDPAHSRYLTEHIAGAKYVELPGDNHWPYLEIADLIADEIELFLTGTRPAPKPPAPPTGRPVDPWATLSRAERNVVDLLSKGLTNARIGEELYISRFTVETHLKHVFTKLGATSRAEVAAEAARRANVAVSP
jgi:pimeloyl-ACP methyl ester carboxylesterase/DNA-binding CsgD family transcriptional regulator